MKTTTSTSTGRDSWATQLRSAIGATVILTILCCGLYPAMVWGVAQTVFPFQANGSLIQRDGTPAKDDQHAVGSALIGQRFAAPGYFHPRPSAAEAGYDAAASSGTNLGPTSKKLIEGLPDDPATADVNESYDGVPQLIAAYRQENGLDGQVAIPADAVTRSASGLDPHISVANARLQAPRVAKARGLDLAAVQMLIDSNTDSRDLGVLGEPGVNVLRLNIALEQRQAGGGK